MAGTSRTQTTAGRTSGTPPRRRRRQGPTWLQRIATFFGVLLMLILMVTAGAIGYATYLFRETAKNLPTPDNLLDYSSGGITEIYATDKDPKTNKYILLGRVFAQNKEYLSITGIPKIVQDATVAIEDERFYTHPGIDLQGIARALYKDVRSKRVEEGASTITQQLARNKTFAVDVPAKNGDKDAPTVFRLGRQQTISRKLKEMVLAMQIEKNYSKEQILEMYLNEVCYGGNNYGIKAASETYFGKEPAKLSLAEAALLVGLPKNPTGYYPYRHLERAVNRRNVVLAKMAELHYITPAQSKAAQQQKVKLIPPVTHTETDFKAPYFTNYVLRQLIDDPRYGYDAVYRGGLKVYTTLNWQMQQEAEKDLVEGVKNFHNEGVTEGALVCIEPRTGFIRTMVGGTDFKHNQFNNVTQGRRQPGSSFKAIVYSAAFDMYPNRFGAEKDVNDSSRTYGRENYRPQNHGGVYHGWLRAESAFASSYNAAAVWLANEIGVKRVIEYAQRMGITSPLSPNLSLALGSNAVTPLEICSAYTTFANGGSRAHPMAIRMVQDNEGAILENNAPTVDVQVLKPSTVENMRQMMKAVVDYGTAANAAGIHDIPEARGKTGTTNDSRDAWFIGFTPELTTAVWVCGVRRTLDKHKHVVVKYLPMQDVYGGSACAPVWAAFMKVAIPIQRQSGEQPQPVATRIVPKVALSNEEKRDQPHDTEMTPTPPLDTPFLDTTPTTAATTTPTVTATDQPPHGDTPAAADVTHPADGAASGTTDTPLGGAPAPDAPVAAPPVEKGDERPTNDATLHGDTVVPAAAPAPAQISPEGAAAIPAAMSADPTPIAGSQHPLHRVTLATAANREPMQQRPIAHRTVTVTLCADTGMLATRWCPETVSRTVPAGQAPKGRCRKHRPMPGDG